MRRLSAIFSVFFAFFFFSAFTTLPEENIKHRKEPKPESRLESQWYGLMVIDFPKEENQPPKAWVLPGVDLWPHRYQAALSLNLTKVRQGLWKAVVPRAWGPIVNPLFFDTQHRQVTAETDFRPRHDLLVTFPVRELQHRNGEVAKACYAGVCGVIYSVDINSVLNCRGRECSVIMPKPTIRPKEL